jgi:hypothetical protein
MRKTSKILRKTAVRAGFALKVGSKPAKQAEA